MNDRSIVSPEDQGATFVELFFDLVFVFAITQVTHYAAHHLDAHGLARAGIVFWLIWWGWTQFTWALNSANTDHRHVQVGTLVATGVAFVMAVSVDRAFSPDAGDSLWFSSSYVAGRLLGLGLYYRVAAGDAVRRSAVRSFAILSMSGMLAVLVGSLVDPGDREWIWLGAIALDFGAAWAAGNRERWGLNPGHFAERHGLIVIIALGESLIVAASALTSDVTVELMLNGAVALIVTCLLWWTYFGWVRGVMEERMVEAPDRERARLGRDAYSFWHFPLVAGIIALAVGFQASLHPGDYTLVQTAAALGVGLALFLTSTAGALWRCTGHVLWNRLLVLLLTLVALALWSHSPAQLLGVACAGLAAIIGIEHITAGRRHF